jgi:Family of unknown function (DUF6516)
LNLRIEEYFQDVETLIQNCSIVRSFDLIPDKRDTYEGFLRIEITFIDQSTLFVREFVSVETSIERDMYSYQYMDSTNNLIFPYDNTPHHQKLNLPTFPHHKHVDSQENVISSRAPFLAEVLQEIIAILI